MWYSQGCQTCGHLLELRETVPLRSVRADLAEIEALDVEIGDLTSLLQAHLSSEQFALVWALRDAVERQAIVETTLREQLSVGGLGQTPQACTHAR
jgi:hypothetical protein